MDFLVAFREASWNFPRQDHDSKEFRGFPGIELGIFRVAKSSGEGLERVGERCDSHGAIRTAIPMELAGLRFL